MDNGKIIHQGPPKLLEEFFRERVQEEQQENRQIMKNTKKEG